MVDEMAWYYFTCTHLSILAQTQREERLGMEIDNKRKRMKTVACEFGTELSMVIWSSLWAWTFQVPQHTHTLLCACEIGKSL